MAPHLENGTARKPLGGHSRFLLPKHPELITPDYNAGEGPRSHQILRRVPGPGVCFWGVFLCGGISWEIKRDSHLWHNPGTVCEGKMDGMHTE